MGYGGASARGKPYSVEVAAAWKAVKLISLGL